MWLLSHARREGAGASSSSTPMWLQQLIRTNGSRGFSIFGGKTHCALNCGILALSHTETEKGDYIRTTHSKLESSSPVCIQIGLFTLVELDYVRTKTASLSVSQKFWHRPNLREWWVGINISGRMVMQLDCKGLSIAANKPTKNNSRRSAGNFRISNLDDFLQKVKCEACSQLA
jgi:hypothetical protein